MKILLVLLGACAMTPSSGDDGGGDPSGSDGGFGSDVADAGDVTPGGGSVAATGWQKLALVDDGNIQHADNDLVSGIVMTSATKGFIVTRGSHSSFLDGGAVFAVDGAKVTVAFSGKNGGPSTASVVDFTGIARTPSGYVAMAYANDVVRGDAAGHFEIVKNGNLAGIEPVIGYSETATRTLLVRSTGVVSVADVASGPNASFHDIWAPSATNKVPAAIPADQCQGGPIGIGSPVLSSSVFIGNGLVAYTSSPHFDPQVCISTDDGASFYPRRFVTDDDAAQHPPSGVAFSSPTNGIAYWGNTTSAPYLKHTSDGGKTWHGIGVPVDVATHGCDLSGAFFAPDGKTGFVVGFDHDTAKSLVLATTDGGASYLSVTGLGDVPLYSGFALDATHVWIGGDDGAVFYKQ
ncbi:MAG TPA: hypothetical protein VGC41_06275 [Kofleriaceae bacterium]